MPALQCQYLVPVNVCVAASVAQLDEARKKVEEEKAAAEEARTVQQLLDNAKVSCLTGRFLDLFQVGPAPPKENVLGDNCSGFSTGWLSSYCPAMVLKH